MESSAEGSLNLKKFTYTSRQLAVSPFSYLHISSPSNSDDSSSLVGSEGDLSKCREGSNFHQRCSSESLLTVDDYDQQPPWLEELLSQPEETDHILNSRCHHRRSASDSCANYIEAAAQESFKEDSKADSSEKPNHNNNNKSSAPKTDSKRAKQQSAHRSRVRKLKYIAELERTVQLLQAERSDMHAELEFVNQQNLILSMENRALMQRLDNLSQEQLIKHFEQEMLERELARLQTLYQLQSQQHVQMQQQPQQQQHSKHRRSKSRDFLPQFANVPMKNKEASSSRGSTSNSVRI